MVLISDTTVKMIAHKIIVGNYLVRK